MRSWLAWLLVLPVALWTGTRVFGLERGFPGAPVMAATPLMTVVAVAVALVVWLLRARLAGLLATLLAVVLVVAVAPRAFGGPSAATGGDGTTITVVSLNLHKGGADPDAVVALARDADVLALQEVSEGVVRRLHRAGLDRLLPHRLYDIGGRLPTDGTALYSRLPMRKGVMPTGTQNPMVTGTIRFGSRDVTLTSVHPMAPVSDWRVRNWKFDLRSLPPAGGEVRVLVGDFNSTLDHHELRRLIGTGYEDAADSLGDGLHYTWPSNGGFYRRITIDHVLADRRCGFRSFRTVQVPHSDHRAIVARVVLPR